jgi:hypothetical protein
MARSRSRSKSRSKSRSRRGSKKAKQSRSLKRLYKYRKQAAYTGIGKDFEHTRTSRKRKSACGRRTQMECTYNPNCEWAEGAGCRRKSDVATGGLAYAGPMRY